MLSAYHGFKNFRPLCLYSCHRPVNRCFLSAALYFNDKRSLSTKSKHKNYYDILGITPRAGKSQIKAAYYRQSKQYHPDVNKSEDAHEKFANIVEAYEVLGNPRTRRLYDKGQRSGVHVRIRKDHDTDYEAIRRYRDLNRPIIRHVQKRTGGELFRGRTSIYNFDEYYEAHYGEHIRAQKTKEVREDIIKEEYEKVMTNKKKDDAHTMWIGIACFLVACCCYFEHKEREMKEVKSLIEEQDQGSSSRPWEWF